MNSNATSSRPQRRRSRAARRSPWFPAVSRNAKKVANADAEPSGADIAKEWSDEEVFEDRCRASRMGGGMTPVAGCAAGDRVAALPMYDLPGLEAANNALWLAVASRLTANGIHNVPPNLSRTIPATELWHSRKTPAPIGRITSFSAKFTDAPLAEGKFETYFHERENAKKPRAVRLSRPQLPMINGSAARRA